ncbi:MAG: hypothetical protein AAF292_13955 [Pseudomonadota bacterium]
MRDLFDQGRAMSPALIRTGTSALSVLLGVAGVIVFLQGLGNLLSFNAPVTGIIQIAGGLGILLAVYLVVRLLSEAVLALHRLNDRLTVLNSDFATARTVQDAAPAKPAATKSAAKPVRRTKAKTTSKPAEEKPPAEKSGDDKAAKSTSAAEA